ncbi:MAG: hypothetical protein H7837_03405 [Magnetococcus sp. MYC-9]
MRTAYVRAFLLWLLLLWPTEHWAGQRIEFSAEVVRSDAAHPDSPSNGMMYVGREAIRTETNQDNQPVWMVFKPASKLVWTIFPKQQLYMERAGLALEWPPLPEDANSPCQTKKFRCQKLGVRSLNDRSTVYWTISVVDEKGETPYAQLWVDQRLNIAIREVYADGLTVEMRRIREAPQATQLFELPTGYKKVAMPVAPTGK